MKNLLILFILLTTAIACGGGGGASSSDGYLLKFKPANVYNAEDTDRIIITDAGGSTLWDNTLDRQPVVTVNLANPKDLTIVVTRDGANYVSSFVTKDQIRNASRGVLYVGHLNAVTTILLENRAKATDYFENVDDFSDLTYPNVNGGLAVKTDAFYTEFADRVNAMALYHQIIRQSEEIDPDSYNDLYDSLVNDTDIEVWRGKAQAIDLPDSENEGINLVSNLLATNRYIDSDRFQLLKPEELRSIFWKTTSSDNILNYLGGDISLEEGRLAIASGATAEDLNVSGNLFLNGEVFVPSVTNVTNVSNTFVTEEYITNEFVTQVSNTFITQSNTFVTQLTNTFLLTDFDTVQGNVLTIADNIFYQGNAIENLFGETITNYYTLDNTITNVDNTITNVTYLSNTITNYLTLDEFDVATGNSLVVGNIILDGNLLVPSVTNVTNVSNTFVTQLTNTFTITDFDTITGNVINSGNIFLSDNIYINGNALVPVNNYYTLDNTITNNITQLTNTFLLSDFDSIAGNLLTSVNIMAGNLSTNTLWVDGNLITYIDTAPFLTQTFGNTTTGNMVLDSLTIEGNLITYIDTTPFLTQTFGNTIAGNVELESLTIDGNLITYIDTSPFVTQSNNNVYMGNVYVAGNLQGTIHGNIISNTLSIFAPTGDDTPYDFADTAFFRGRVVFEQQANNDTYVIFKNNGLGGGVPFGIHGHSEGVVLGPIDDSDGDPLGGLMSFYNRTSGSFVDIGPGAGRTTSWSRSWGTDAGTAIGMDTDASYQSQPTDTILKVVQDATATTPHTGNILAVTSWDGSVLNDGLVVDSGGNTQIRELKSYNMSGNFTGNVILSEDEISIRTVNGNDWVRFDNQAQGVEIRRRPDGGSGGGYLQFYDNSGGSRIMRFYGASDDVQIRDENDDIAMTFVQSSGMDSIDFAVPINSANILPSANLTYDLGSNSRVWRDIWTEDLILASDRRLKKNIEDTTYGVNTIMQLRPVEYDTRWTNKHKIGLIAQEVEEVVPEVVERGHYMGVNYTDLIPVLIKAIQEQQVEIEELKRQLK